MKKWSVFEIPNWISFVTVENQRKTFMNIYQSTRFFLISYIKKMFKKKNNGIAYHMCWNNVKYGIAIITLLLAMFSCVICWVILCVYNCKYVILQMKIQTKHLWKNNNKQSKHVCCHGNAICLYEKVMNVF